METSEEPAAETSFDVLLYIYDLSKELAKSFKKILKGKPLPGVWHTGLVAYGREYYFGSSGIESCRPGETILGEPDQILTLGKTELPYSVFLEYIFGLGETTYKPGSYHLLEHNGNGFSQEVCQFLTGAPIPSEIRDIPQEITGNKNLSGALTEYFDKLSLKAEGSRGISFGQPPVAEGQRNGHGPGNGGARRKKSSVNGTALTEGQPSLQRLAGETPAQMEPTTSQADSRATNGEEEEAQTSPSYTPRRSRRYDDPPITYPDVEGPSSLRRLMEVLEGKVSPEERRDLDDLLEYLTTDGGAWALGTSHLETLGRLLNDRSLSAEVPCLALRSLQSAALKEDAILLLHQDRERHHLMSHLNRIETLPDQEQREVAVLMCNLCSQASSYDWLTYISEWEEEGRPCSNARATVRAAVHALLAPHAREPGCALVYNLALKKELFDDIATELAMAVMQLLNEQLPEDLVFQSLTALYRFMCISYNEVPALLKMMGPDVEAFRGLSPRVDPILDEIQAKLRACRT